MTRRNTWWLSILIGFLVYVGLIEPYWIKVETHSLAIPGFPPGIISIVHISDTHTTGIGLRERKLIKIVREIQPDYVFVTGDLLKHDSTLREGLALMSMLEARRGVFAVCGNADSAIHKAKERGILREDGCGARFLFNESVDCGDFILVGIDDPVTYRARPSKALAGLPADRPAIALTHFHPDRLLEDLEDAGVDIVFSGHTHGGQLGIPAVVRLVPYASRSDYISGFYNLGDMHLNVSKGIGTNIFPFRFLCRPQVDVFYIRGIAE
jgi:predicted MPP superfamily phosphohydrolase